MSDFLTVTEFADRLGLKRHAVYAAIRQNRITSIRLLDKLGVPRSELKRFKRRKNGNKTQVLKKAA